ncbi:MAG: hypothetical protein A3E82_04520 [Gammaproteobacteria bacterium RIFCSPHIGHO2_12_FULL_38_11]|nr:MAG: hypothetical protein A3E82_04520 [Gammaproteobacteria bacterium RIFCSPHIGHO2_12_FULL_38_11]
MKKFLSAGLTLVLSFATLSAVAAPLHWISLSSNVSGGVNMDCTGVDGGTGSPMFITSTPTVSWWGGITSHFQSTFLKCKFVLPNTTTQVGSMTLRVWTVPNLPGALSATIYNPISNSGYALVVKSSHPLPPPGHQPSFYDYTVTMNALGQK